MVNSGYQGDIIPRNGHKPGWTRICPDASRERSQDNRRNGRRVPARSRSFNSGLHSSRFDDDGQAVDSVLVDRDTRNIRWFLCGGCYSGKNEEVMIDQAILAIAPIVSLMILVGVSGAYFARKERRESREADGKKQV